MHVVSRRSFLSSTLAAGGVLGIASPGGRAAEPSRRIPIGFLGTAYSHFRDKHTLLRESSDFELVGLCEEDPEARARGPAGARWLTRDALFAQAEVVVVEGHIRDRADHARAALEAGRHVHVEKPPATSLAAFRRLIDLARERSRVFQVGYMWRYNPGIQRALEAARSGWLGRVFQVRATMNTWLSAERRPEWAEFRGGAMFEQGCHLIDAMVRILGRPRSVTPFLKRSGFFEDTLADNTVAVFEFESALGIISSAPLQPNAGAHRFLEVLGTRGTARVQPLEPPALALDLAEAAGPYSKGRQTVELPPYRRYEDEFVDLAAAVRGTRALPVDLDTELAVHEAVMRACGEA